MKNKTDKNILIAFLINICFSIIEFFGGLFTGSIAIISDAFHDLIDAISIGVSYYLERKSKESPDYKYTYGYIRYSVLGAFLMATILSAGSILVIIASILRLINPVSVNYDGMIAISILGIIFNFIAAYKTKEGDSLNQKAVNLHMLEDVMGWIVVFIGSILIKFTSISYIDSIMSILISIFILVHALKNLKSVLELFLEKVPNNIDIKEIKEELLKIKEIIDVHHIHVWSIDGYHNYATLHIVTNDKKNIKKTVRNILLKENISHVTIELENENEICNEKVCKIKDDHNIHYHHH